MDDVPQYRFNLWIEVCQRLPEIMMEHPYSKVCIYIDTESKYHDWVVEVWPRD